MSPSISWIDERQWARLLEGAGLETENGGGANNVLPQQRSVVRPLPSPDDRQPTADGDEQATRSASIAPPPPANTLTTRLQQLMAWAQTTTDASRVFICDENGLPLASQHTDLGWTAAAAVLQRALGTLRPIWPRFHATHLSIELDVGTTLHLIVTGNRWGHFILGLATAGALGPAHLDALRQALARAFEEKGNVHG